MIQNYLNKRIWVIIFAVVIMLITTVPYLVGFASEGDDWIFTGFVIGVEDGNSYIGKMLTGSSGSWIFRTPYSAANQQGVIAFLPYILLGKLAAGPAVHGQLVVIYHCFRIMGGILAILAAYDLISIFITKMEFRWWALVIYTLGGGGGWILVLLEKKDFFDSLPLDFISPESFGFLGLLGFPHLALARAMLLWGLVSYLTKKPGYLTGVLFLGMGLLQPMYVVIAWCVIGVHILLQWFDNKLLKNKKKLKNDNQVKEDYSHALKTFIISSPLIFYTSFAFITDPFLKEWTSQNSLPSPHIIHYIVAYGLYIPFVIGGIKKVMEENRRKGLLLAGWLSIFLILVYAPVATQRRLAEGIWAVITIGLIYYFENKHILQKSVKWIASFAFLSTMLIFIGSILSAKSTSIPLFRPKEEISMFQHISEIVETDSVILSAFSTGNNLPAWAPVKVVFGHGPETINFEDVKNDVDMIYSSATEKEKRNKLLEKYQVDYIVLGPAEKEIGSWDINMSEQLIKVYDNGGYAVFRNSAGNRK